jgi:type IV secretion system protein TrbL
MKIIKNYMLKMVLMVFALIIPALASAGTVSTGVFNTIEADMQTSMQSWYGPMYNGAVATFTGLALIEITWLGAVWLLSRKTFEDIIPSLVKKLITLGFFYAILLNSATWVPDIMNTLMDMGQAASHMPTISPSQIAGDAINVFFNVFHQSMDAVTGNTSTAIVDIWSGNWAAAANSAKKAATALATDALAPGLVLGLDLIIGAILYLSIIYLALELMVVQIESFFVLSVGVVMLGFGGARWTARFVEPYLHYALATGMRLLIITLMAGFFETKLNPILNQTIVNGGGSLGSYFVALSLALVIAFLVKKLPNIASSILSGQSSLSGGELYSQGVKTAAVAGAAVVAASVVGAAGVAAGSAGGMSAGGAGSASGSGAGSLSASAASGAPVDPAAGVPAPKHSPQQPSDLGVPAPTTPIAPSSPSTPSTASAPGGESNATQASSPAAGQSGGNSGVALDQTPTGAGKSAGGSPDGAGGASGPGGAPAPSSPSAGESSVTQTSSNGGSGTGNTAPAGGPPGGSPKSTWERAQDAAGTVYKGVSKAHEHLSPGESSTGGVSAPGGGTKHLDD